MVQQALHPPAVHASMQDAVNEFSQILRDIFGQRLLALTLTGGVTTAGFRPGEHTAKSVVVLEEVALTGLRRLADEGTKLGRLNIAAPMVMTPAYIQESLDTFPLELLDIVERHLTVLGTDFFADLNFHERDMRLQCERELKVAALTMRQGLLASLGLEEFIEKLERDLAEGLLRVVRGMLWLKGDREALPMEQAVTRLESLLAHKLPGIRAALDDENPAGWREFDWLYADVDALGKAVNGW